MIKKSLINKCNKCNEIKPINSFPKAKCNKSGLSHVCRDCLRVSAQIYRSNNREKVKETKSKYYDRNKDTWNDGYKTIEAKAKRKIKNSTEEAKKKNRDYVRQKRQSDNFYKLKTSLRNRINEAFKVAFWRKHGRTSEILGASFDICRKHLERQFTKGMTWDNHGQWHIDHKVPLASAKTEEELTLLCHYTNLQPLWSEDNQKKYNKILPVQTIMAI